MGAALEGVVPEPKERSATWLTSTYAVDDESEDAKFCSGKYQVGRLVRKHSAHTRRRCCSTHGRCIASVANTNKQA